jgi:hypothetical protein
MMTSGIGKSLEEQLKTKNIIEYENSTLWGLAELAMEGHVGGLLRCLNYGNLRERQAM